MDDDTTARYHKGPPPRDRAEEAEYPTWDQEQAAARRASARERDEARFAAGYAARQAARVARLRGVSEREGRGGAVDPEQLAEAERGEEAIHRYRAGLPARDDYERGEFREWAELDADAAQEQLAAMNEPGPTKEPYDEDWAGRQEAAAMTRIAGARESDRAADRADDLERPF